MEEGREVQEGKECGGLREREGGSTKRKSNKVEQGGWRRGEGMSWSVSGGKIKGVE